MYQCLLQVSVSGECLFLGEGTCVWIEYMGVCRWGFVLMREGVCFSARVSTALGAVFLSLCVTVGGMKRE